MAKIEADKELTLKELGLQAQAQFNTATSNPTPPNRDAKSRKLKNFVDEKDEIDSHLLRFERYAENAKWEKVMWAIKLSALLSGRAMAVYTRMSNKDDNDCNKMKKAPLLGTVLLKMATDGDSGMSSQRLMKHKQFVVLLKN